MIEIKYLNKQWYVRTDPKQLPEEEMVFDTFEQVSQFVEGYQGLLLIDADDSCPRPEEYYAGVGEAPRVSCEEIAREANDLAARDFVRDGCQSKGMHLQSCDKDGFCNFCGEQ